MILHDADRTTEIGITAGLTPVEKQETRASRFYTRGRIIATTTIIPARRVLRKRKASSEIEDGRTCEERGRD